jgi:hypothetical protein
VKPFLSTALGYQWTSTRSAATSRRSGASPPAWKFPPAPSRITPRISYADDFENTRNSSQAWTVQTEVNYWVEPDDGVFGSIGHSDVRRSPIDSWNYQFGLRARF